MVTCPRCGSTKTWTDKPQYDKDGNIILHGECQNVECNNKWTGHYELVETKQKQ